MRLRTTTFAIVATAAATIAAGVDASTKFPLLQSPVETGDVAPGESVRVELPDAMRDLRGVLPMNDKGGLTEMEGLAAPDPFPALDHDSGLVESDFRGVRPAPKQLDKMRREAESGPVRVIVTMRTQMGLAGRLGQAGAHAQEAAFAKMQQKVLDRLGDRGAKVRHRYQTVPQMALSVDAAALDALAKDPDVARIQEDKLSSVDLAVSVPIIGAADVQDRGYDGSGRVVAVLDTGIDRNHAALRGFVGEACFTWSDCPNGSGEQIGSGAAAACTDLAGCSHGTHVAGIAAGATAAGVTTVPGVAPGARIMPIQVFSRWTGYSCTSIGLSSPCLLSSNSDQLAALEYVYQQRNNYPMSSVNISIGDGAANTGYCDGDSRKPIIDQLRSVGIATIITSGNKGHTNGIGAPGCISSAITVGATDNDDIIASFTNSGNGLDLLAPGVNILSSCVGGDFCAMSGTSMAAPHVAGAWALMHEQGLLSVNQVGTLLASKGTPITDTRSGAGSRVRPRIQVLSAMGLDVPGLVESAPVNYRSPNPYRHDFQYQPVGANWSAIGVRSAANADHVAYLYEDGPTVANRPILASSLATRGTVGVIMQNNTAGARPISRDYPQVLLTSGEGRYSIELSNPGLSLGNSAIDFLTSNDVIRVWNVALTAGRSQSFRVRPSTGADLELMIFGSDPARSQPHLMGRSQARVVASANGPGIAEMLTFTPATTGTYAVVVTQRSGAGVFNLFRDDSAPTGSIVIANGAATTTTRNVKLTLTANDSQSGVDSMRLCLDGTCDTETFIAFASAPTVTLPVNTGTSRVSVQYRNSAGIVSPIYSDTIEVTATPISVSIDNAAAYERDDYRGERPKMVFTVRLSEVAPANVSVTMSPIAAGTATSNDYANPPSYNVVIPAGQLSTTFWVYVDPDTTVEGNETFYQRIASATFARIGDGEAMGTIIDDDTAGPNYRIYVNVRGDLMEEPKSGTEVASAQFVLSKSTPLASNVSIVYQTVDGTAIAPADYTARSGTAVIPAGQLSVTVPITIRSDAVDEGSELFELRATSVTGGGALMGVDRALIEIIPPYEPPYYE